MLPLIPAIQLLPLPLHWASFATKNGIFPGVIRYTIGMPHIHEVYDFVVVVFVVHDGRVLLVHHPRYDKWIPIGGHIELDEDPEEALYREIAEECGLDVEILADNPDLRSPSMKSLPTPSYMEMHEANPPHRHIGLIYFARAKGGDFTMSDEHSDLRWLSRTELRDPRYKLPDDIIFYAEKALDAAA